MITEKTFYQTRYESIQKLIETLKPIAAKYKAPYKAEEALKAINWRIVQGNSTKIYKWVQGESIEVYEYGQKYSTLPEILEMIERVSVQFVPEEKSKVYTMHLCKFIDDAIGETIECTKTDFQNRKQQTIEALNRAIEFVNSLEDCKNTTSYQFDQSE